jgi:hypothetical protein
LEHEPDLAEPPYTQTDGEDDLLARFYVATVRASVERNVFGGFRDFQLSFRRPMLDPSTYECA